MYNQWTTSPWKRQVWMLYVYMLESLPGTSAALPWILKGRHPTSSPGQDTWNLRNLPSIFCTLYASPPEIWTGRAELLWSNSFPCLLHNSTYKCLERYMQCIFHFIHASGGSKGGGEHRAHSPPLESSNALLLGRGLALATYISLTSHLLPPESRLLASYTTHWSIVREQYYVATPTIILYSQDVPPPFWKSWIRPCMLCIFMVLLWRHTN